MPNIIIIYVRIFNIREHHNIIYLYEVCESVFYNNLYYAQSHKKSLYIILLYTHNENDTNYR